MNIFSVAARKGTRSITNVLLIGVSSLVAVAGTFLVTSGLYESFEETSFTRSLRCAATSSAMPDCPSYIEKIQHAKDDLANAQTDAFEAQAKAEQILADAKIEAIKIREDAREEATIAEEKVSELQAEADAAKARLQALEVVQKADNSFIVFANSKAPQSGATVQVGTVYSKLVPPDASPLFECSVVLPDGSEGEQRRYWYKSRNDSVIDDRAKRAKLGITDADFAYAKSVCKPTIIGG